MEEKTSVIAPGRGQGLIDSLRRLVKNLAVHPVGELVGHAGGRDAGEGRGLAVASRLLLYPSEVCRLPRSSRAVRVLSGVAWVTNAGRDILVREGQVASLNKERGFALASSLSGTPLVLEVLTSGN